MIPCICLNLNLLNQFVEKKVINRWLNCINRSEGNFMVPKNIKGRLFKQSLGAV